MNIARFAWLVAVAGCAHDGAPRGAGGAPPVGHTADVHVQTKRTETSDIIHGVSVSDPYRWLEDGRSTEVIQWAEAQDLRARRYLDSLPEHSAIVARLTELMFVGDVAATIPRPGRYFSRRRDAGQEKYRVYVRDASAESDRLLIDPNAWPVAEHKAFKAYLPSPDGRYVAMEVSRNNADESVVEVVDGRTGATVDVIQGVRYEDFGWDAGSAGIYYTWYPAGVTSGFARSEVRYHAIGKDSKNDEAIAPATGSPDVEQWVVPSSDGRWLLLHQATGWLKTDVYFAPAKSPKAWRPLVVGKSARYAAVAYKDKFYILTNDGAPRYRVVRADAERPASAAWEEIVGERSDATLAALDIVGGHLALRWTKDAASELEVRGLEGKEAKKIALPGLGLVSDLAGREDGDEIFFRYESHIQAPRVYRLSARTGEMAVVSSVKSIANEDAYVVENVPYRAKDGSRGVVVLIHERNAKRDGSAPAYFMGYGAHGISVQADYRASTLAWLEQGGIYALPVIRGGGEYGEEWHRQGMGVNKQHSIDDFIAAAEELVRQGWTRSDRLVASGASMGGLLVASAITQRPDLFCGAVLEAPITDVVRYPLSGAGKRWLNELGDPEKPDEFLALWSYSPYHHVQPGVQYPPTLVMTIDSDDRVDGLHGRKFVAALQNASPRSRMLMTIERHQGHGMSDSVSGVLNARADKFAFALAQVHERAAVARPVPTK